MHSVSKHEIRIVIPGNYVVMNASRKIHSPNTNFWRWGRVSYVKTYRANETWGDGNWLWRRGNYFHCKNKWPNREKSSPAISRQLVKNVKNVNGEGMRPPIKPGEANVDVEFMYFCCKDI
jgi:hypothetical protein